MRSIRTLPFRDGAQLVFLFLLLVGLRWAFLEHLDALALDFSLRLRGEQRPDPRIVIVAIDDGSLASVGSWPWSVEIQDQLMARIVEREPLAVGVDLLLGKPLDHYPSIRQEPKVVLATSLGQRLARDGPELFWQEPGALPEGGPVLGHIHADKDPDGVCRSIPLLVNWDGRRRWAFSVEVARLVQGIGTREPSIEGDSILVGQIAIPRLREPIDDSLDSMGLLADFTGDHLLINGRGGPGTFPLVSAADVLNGENWVLDRLVGRIVLVGATSYTLGDHLATAFSGPSEMPGIEIHANAVDTILNRRFISAMGDAAVLLLVFSTILALWGMNRYWSQARSLAVFLVWVAGAIIVPTGLFFLTSYWVPMATVLVTVVLTSGAAQFMHYSLLNRQLNERFLRLADVTKGLPTGDQLFGSTSFFSRRTIEWKTRILGEVTESALRLNQQREEMMSFVSHELKTPLTSIHGFADLLLKSDALGADQRSEALTLIRSETERLTAMVEAYLRISRIEHRSLEPVVERHSLTGLLEKAAALIGPQLREKGITLLGLEAVPDCAVEVDGNMMTQVFLNLFSNAVKFSPGDSSIEVKGTLQPGEAVISIRDHGFGIAPEELPKIFDKFYRGRLPDHSKAPGSGLGLNFVKEVISLHRGRIEVESQTGAGTTFVVHLPRSQKEVASP